MRFIAECSVLTRALGACREIADQRATIDVLASTKLTLVGNTLTLEATDMNMKLSTYIEVDGREDGIAALSAQRLFEIVKDLPSGAAALICGRFGSSP